MILKLKRTILWAAGGCCILIIGIVVLMMVKSSRDTQLLLEDSIKTQLMSICTSARESINPSELVTWNSEEEAKASPEYQQTHKSLSRLAMQSGADYIYILREFDGRYYFVMDTDTFDTSIFIEYDIAQVHKNAFAGVPDANIMNVVDEWGSYNTGAVPIYHNGSVVAIVSADITDTYISQSRAAARRNMILLVLVLAVVLSAVMIALDLMLVNLKKMQDALYNLANYDRVTNLPNRNFLFKQLSEMTPESQSNPFALFFIDLDNFKSVNDSAGHDAGDELLRNIADYLNEYSRPDMTAFRPSAGSLNVAARIGGDEFILLLSNLSTPEEASRWGEDLLNNFGGIGGNIGRYIDSHRIGLSIGIALCPVHTDDYNVLIKYADIAMYHAKRAGKNRCVVYNDSLTPKEEK